MRALLVRIVCYLLKVELTTQQKTRLIGAILDTSNAVPLSEVITFGQNGMIYVQGKLIDQEKAIQLRESARLLINNGAMNLIYEQVRHIAGTRGVAEGDTPEKLVFYRAALWWGEKELETIVRLASL